MISIIKETKLYMKNQQHKMNLYCLQCTKFTNNNDIKVKHEIDGKISIYYLFIDCGCIKFETIGKEEISFLSKNFNIHIKQCYRIV